MLRTLKKMAAVGAMTVLAMTGLTATGGAAFAADASSAVTVANPICYGIMDTLGNGGSTCVSLVRSSTGYSNEETQVVYTAEVNTTVCYLGKCVPTRTNLGKTGVGADQDQLRPVITQGSVRVPIIVGTCIRTSVCTPDYVDVPTLKIDFFPSGNGPVFTVCGAGACANSPLTRLSLDSERYVELAAASLA